MSFTVSTLAVFDKELKNLVRKYPSLLEEYATLIQELEVSPSLGTPIGRNCYKVRLAIKSKGKGKRGGARVVTNVHVEGETVTLLSIYDKSEKSTLTDKELTALLGMLPQLPSGK